MEIIFAVFPRHGKFPAVFSTLWKTYFHTMENSRPTLPSPPAPFNADCALRPRDFQPHEPVGYQRSGILLMAQNQPLANVIL